MKNVYGEIIKSFVFEMEWKIHRIYKFLPGEKQKCLVSTFSSLKSKQIISIPITVHFLYSITINNRSSLAFTMRLGCWRSIREEVPLNYCIHFVWVLKNYWLPILLMDIYNLDQKEQWTSEYCNFFLGVGWKFVHFSTFYPLLH